MSTKSRHIPIHALPAGAAQGIMIMRECFNGAPMHEAIRHPHRDGGYTFIIQEKGITHIEIDFETYIIQASSITYIHPNQVHRLIEFEEATISTWMITEENLHPEYVNFLDKFSPVNALSLTSDTLFILSSMASVCLGLADRRHDKLYHATLKDGCNTLVGLVISQYLALQNTNDTYNRFGEVTRLFKQALEQGYKLMKSPASYAERLNLSTSYLNECVKAHSGQSVSFHIQQRVILEAKRLLYHSGKSVKEIAGELGYDDYSYFIRLFVKSVGMTPVAFRSQNRD